MAIGIMGGTFDPIHIGHLLISEYIKEELGLNKILFIPTGDPPHKPERITSARVRLELVKKAIADNPAFDALSIETERIGKTYTVDTISELEALYPGQKIYYIIGSDTLFKINSWKDPWLLKGRVTFVVYSRLGGIVEIESEIEILKERLGLSFYRSNGPVIDISSTEIRRRLGSRKSIKYMVPESIISDIDKIEIELEFDLESLESVVKDRLGERRFRHTMGVADKARELASQNGVDEDKAYVAALLHDLAKPMNLSDMLKAAGESGIMFDSDTLSSPDLLHGHIGAYLAESLLGVHDSEILDAIRFHTTGRPGMSTLEKVIYLADFIEPGRSFPGIDHIRNLSISDLDAAVVTAMESTINHLKRNNKQVHKSTLESMECLIRDKKLEI